MRAGALALARSIQYLPPGVVLAVVDPGVGTDRRAVAVEVETGYLVGPDNGLLAPAVAMLGGASRVVSLTNPEYQLEAPGATFAGRDIFAPAAGYLAAGTPLELLGEPVDPLSLVPGTVPLPSDEGGRAAGEVLWIDRYGNAQLNIDPGDLAALGRGAGRRRWRSAAARSAAPAAGSTSYAEAGPVRTGRGGRLLRAGFADARPAGRRRGARPAPRLGGHAGPGGRSRRG